MPAFPGPAVGKDKPATASPSEASTSTNPPQTPPPTSAPSADAKHAAVSARQVAIVGLIGVLVAALFSVLTGIVTARLAGESAANVTSQQLEGETAAKSKAEFLRGQRQVLYTKFITHEAQLADAELEAARAGSPFRKPDLEQKLQDMKDLLTTLKYDVSAAQIIGSPEVRSLLTRIHYRHLLITIRVDMITSPETSAGSESKLDRQWSEYAHQKDELLGQFMKAAQKDMGS